MQKTRQQILEILNQHGQCTVHEIVDALQMRRGDNITAVTVRHHLGKLLDEELVTSNETKYLNKPGRPQHIYTLTNQARHYLPSNYQTITSGLIKQIKTKLPPQSVNVIFEGLVDDLANHANIAPDVSLEERLHSVVSYLNEQGYDATWEQSKDGYMLHTRNCPYHEIAQSDDTLCEIDVRLIASLVGKVPRQLSRVSCGDGTCSYFFPIHP